MRLQTDLRHSCIRSDREVQADNAPVVQETRFSCGTCPRRTIYLNKDMVPSQHIYSGLHGTFQVNVIFCPRPFSLSGLFILFTLRTCVCVKVNLTISLCPYKLFFYIITMWPSQGLLFSDTQLQSQHSPLQSALDMSRLHITGASLEKISPKLPCSMLCKNHFNTCPKPNSSVAHAPQNLDRDILHKCPTHISQHYPAKPSDK